MPATELHVPAAAQPRRLIRLVKFYKGNIAKSTCYAWARAGRIKIYKVGGLSYTDETFPQFVRRQAEGGGK